ncbi:decaprenylphospho-beta-D-erythro-pentofuranosid-2-ulose 2-reductase, partial [Streptomyces sp. NPDC002454]
TATANSVLSRARRGRTLPSTTPEAVATAVEAGLRRGAESVWVPGVLRVLMSALRHLPRAAFRRLGL